MGAAELQSKISLMKNLGLDKWHAKPKLQKIFKRFKRCKK